MISRQPVRPFQHTRVLALCAAIGIFSIATASSRELRPGIIGEDDRVRVDDLGAPWTAIGQVNVGGYRRANRCTGTLIAANVVLTAAHCVIDAWRKAPFPLHDIHFLAGVRGSENGGHATAKCLHFAKGYESSPGDRTHDSSPDPQVRDLTSDIVAIVLNDKLDVEPMPVAESAQLPPDMSLTHAAYAADRRFALSVHAGCHIQQFDRDAPLWLTDCDTHPASSGGPLLARVDGALKLVAIMIGTRGHVANVALPISRWKELVRVSTCP